MTKQTKALLEKNDVDHLYKQWYVLSHLQSVRGMKEQKNLSLTFFVTKSTICLINGNLWDPPWTLKNHLRKISILAQYKVSFEEISFWPTILEYLRISNCIKNYKFYIVDSTILDFQSRFQEHKLMLYVQPTYTRWFIC